jgi:endonuclease/exonuclease/phosphatase family metal-dependent hydrolase
LYRTRAAAAAVVASTAFVVYGPLGAPARAQLRIVSMNGANSDGTAPRTPWINTILSAIGSTVSNDPTSANDGGSGIAKPIDVLALQEVQAASSTCAQYANLLNAIYPGANYQYVNLTGASTGSGTQGLVYNANAVQVIGSSVVGSASGSGQARQALRYQLRPVGYGAAADVYLYNSHYKSDTGSTNEARRDDEAQAIRANADALGAGKNVIYLGDFNVYTSSEDMYQTLLAAGNGKAVDPINKPGAWNNSSTYHAIHTQSPFNATTASTLHTGFSGTTGGMDDRFDQQLITSSMMDGHGVAYIPNSYYAFGNNGTGALNTSINDATNHFPGTTAAQRNGPLLDALAGVLDHLPVVADYQIPAKMTASLSSVPSQVIVGGSLSATLSVSNSANVVAVNGADALTYTYASSGSAGGSGSSSDAALGGGNSHTITFNTAAVGPKSAMVTATGTSEAVANGSFSQNVNYTVLDHADPSFSDSSSATSQTVDFGYVPVGSATRTSAFSVWNRSATNRAGLDVDSVTNSGDTARLTTNATTSANLAAGGSRSYNASLNSAVAGNFTATHTFATSDQNLTGAAARSNLVLTTTSRVFSVATFPVSGFMFLPASEPLATGPFSISGGVTLTKTGPGAMTIDGAQSNGAGSQLVLNGGSTTFETDAGGATGIASLGVSVNSGATASFNSVQHLSLLALNGGAGAALGSGGGGGGNTLAVNTLAVDTPSGSKLDITNNALVVRGSPLPAVAALVKSGFNAGAWNGAGINSSTAGIAANITAIGMAGNAALGRSAFEGITGLTSSDVLVKYTYYGDADLSGAVTLDDFAQFLSGYQGGGATWQQGDFDYSGSVTLDDFTLFLNGYQQQRAPLTSVEAEIASSPRLTDAERAAMIAAVLAIPEPGCIAGLVLLGGIMVRRRRVAACGFAAR